MPMHGKIITLIMLELLHIELLHSPEQALTVAVQLHTISNLVGKVWTCTTIYVGGVDFCKSLAIRSFPNGFDTVENVPRLSRLTFRC